MFSLRFNFVPLPFFTPKCRSVVGDYASNIRITQDCSGNFYVARFELSSIMVEYDAGIITDCSCEENDYVPVDYEISAELIPSTTDSSLKNMVYTFEDMEDLFQSPFESTPGGTTSLSEVEESILKALEEIVPESELIERNNSESGRCDISANSAIPEEVLNLTSKTVDGFLALQEAIIKGRLSDADAALRGDCNLNDKNHSGQTPLHLAVIYQEKEITRLLLNSNADVSVKDVQGNTALHLCIRKKEDDFKLYGCFKVLIESKNIGKIVNSLNSQGFSPLHIAAINGSYEEAKYLLKKGADVNLKDGTSGRTALFHAVEQRDIKFINLLIGNGADINARNMSRQTPYMAAKILGKKNESEEIKRTGFNKFMYFYSL